MNELQKLESFRADLAVAETMEAIKVHDSAAAAMAEFAKKQKLSVDKQNEIGRFRIEVEEKKGAYLDDRFPKGGDRKSTKSKLPFGTLIDEGITKKESTKSRTIANATEDAKAEIMDEIENKGEVITPNKVNAELRKRERLTRNKEIREQNKALETTKTYRIIYADPPWSYNDKMNTEKMAGAEKHYPTMPLSDICAMPVSEITEPDAVLFLWTTSPLLEESFEVINAWGFKYKTSFIWDKVKHNMGHYNSVRHEFLLICTKGSCTPDNKKLFDSVQSIPRTGRHSEKPDEFREIIETLYTHGDKIELFARDKKKGWDAYGNEVL